MKKMKLLTTALCAGVLAIASLGLAGCTDNSREYLEAFEQSELVTQYSYNDDYLDPTPFALTECEVEMTEQNGYEVAAITATLQNENLKVDMQVLGTKNEFDEYTFTPQGDPVVTPLTGITRTRDGYKISEHDEITETFNPETNTCVVTADNLVIQDTPLAIEVANDTVEYEWLGDARWWSGDGSFEKITTVKADQLAGTYKLEDGVTITLSDVDSENCTATLSSDYTLDWKNSFYGLAGTYEVPSMDAEIYVTRNDDDEITGLEIVASESLETDLPRSLRAYIDLAFTVEGEEIQAVGTVSLDDGVNEGDSYGIATKE